MGTSSVPQAGKNGYLSPCAHCGADNGVTATTCWRCESPIESPSPTGLDLMLGRDRAPATPATPADPHDQSATVHDARRPPEGEPSFFPVLREEVPGTPDAANDAPGAQARKPARSRTRSAQITLAIAAVLVLVIAYAPDLFDAASPTATAADPRDARPTPTVSVAQTAPPAAPAAVVVPAVPASPACTPAVDALGLCPAPVH